MTTKRWPAIRVGLIVAAAGLMGSLMVFSSFGDWLLERVEGIRGLGVLGVLVFVAAYVVATLLMVPGSGLTLAAGFVYGPLVGTAIVSPASVVAATAAFLLGRSALRGWVSKRIERMARFRAVDAAIGAQGLKVVLLLRLSPLLPFTLLNYALGTTKVRLRDYVLGSWLGMLPGTALYVYIGSVFCAACARLSGSHKASGPAFHALYVAGLVATVLATVMITRAARRALARSVEHERRAP